MEQIKEAYTVIFLLDQQPPTKIILLKREPSRYGGDLYTGIGGHFEPEKDLSIKASAERELGEEIPDYRNIPITEFASVLVNDQKWLHYFYGLVDSTKPLPEADQREGQIFWVPVNDLLCLNIFPTTRPLLAEWVKRNFRTDKPWTMYLSGQNDKNGLTANVVVDKVEGN